MSNLELYFGLKLIDIAIGVALVVIVLVGSLIVYLYERRSERWRATDRECIVCGKAGVQSRSLSDSFETYCPACGRFESLRLNSFTSMVVSKRP